MSRTKFKVGDVVRACGGGDGNQRIDGVKGIVITVHPRNALSGARNYTVCFDKNIGGLEGIRGRCWNCKAHNLDVVKAAPPEKKKWNKAW